jgi:Xaa-Pro aminopeptidase
MHGLGHGIGLLVHDPDQKDRDGIGVGSAYSIEPGIYVRRELLDIIPKAGNEALLAKIAPAVGKYANTGVRIEDNYIVTEAGVKWVSCVAREVDEVEALMREPVRGPAVRDAERVGWYGTAVVDPTVAKPNAAPPAKSCNPKM